VIWKNLGALTDGSRRISFQHRIDGHGEATACAPSRTVTRAGRYDRKPLERPTVSWGQGNQASFIRAAD